MNKSRIKPIYILGIVLILIILVILVVVIRFGKAYQLGLAQFTPLTPQEVIKLKKTKNIRKITITKEDEESCLEVTPDGVVRIYTICNQELSQAVRLANPKNILKLFQAVVEERFASCEGQWMYELMIESEAGSERVCVATDISGGGEGGGGGGGGGGISGIIDEIIGDVPGTVSPSPGAGVPSPTPGSSLLPSPASSGQAFASPSPSPPTSTSPQPFVCNFSETGGSGKPYRVSNVVCTSEPSTAP